VSIVYARFHHLFTLEIDQEDVKDIADMKVFIMH
jgi:hypothetical protein